MTIGYHLMRMIQFDWAIDWRGSPSADATSGFTQTVFNAFPRWVGTVGVTLSYGWIGHWRAAMWAGQGRAGIYRLPMIDPAIFNRASVLTAAQMAQGNPFSTGSYFSTGSGFDPGPFIPATEAAAAGATEIRVTTANAALVPVPGQILSADDWPMGVTYVVPEDSNVYRLGIQMPLRAAIAEGAPVRLVAMGRFEVLDDLAGRTPYGFQPSSTPSISFREVLTR
ncbi:MAG TPA: hypothetical protein DEB47_17785 [Citreicella sp.]|nr:hypothetical protein [Citreicella sp.]